MYLWRARNTDSKHSLVSERIYLFYFQADIFPNFSIFSLYDGKVVLNDLRLQTLVHIVNGAASMILPGLERRLVRYLLVLIPHTVFKCSFSEVSICCISSCDARLLYFCLLKTLECLGYYLQQKLNRLHIKIKYLFIEVSPFVKGPDLWDICLLNLLCMCAYLIF